MHSIAKVSKTLTTTETQQKNNFYMILQPYVSTSSHYYVEKVCFTVITANFSLPGTFVFIYRGFTCYLILFLKSLLLVCSYSAKFKRHCLAQKRHLKAVCQVFTLCIPLHNLHKRAFRAQAEAQLLLVQDSSVNTSARVSDPDNQPHQLLKSETEIPSK